MWLVSHSYCLYSYCLFFLILMSFFLENISASRYVYTCGGISVKEPTYQCKRHNETGVQTLAREDPLEEDMTTHSNVLSWRIPWTEEPGGLQSIGSQRVRQDWSDLASMHTYRHICFSFKCKIEVLSIFSYYKESHNILCMCLDLLLLAYLEIDC